MQRIRQRLEIIAGTTWGRRLLVVLYPLYVIAALAALAGAYGWIVSLVS